MPLLKCNSVFCMLQRLKASYYFTFKYSNIYVIALHIRRILTKPKYKCRHALLMIALGELGAGLLNKLTDCALENANKSEIPCPT